MRAASEIVVERPVEAVWEWASDPRHWHRWQDGVGEVRLDGDPGEGTRFASGYEYGGEVRSVGGGLPFEGTVELTADVRGTRVRYEVDAGPDDALARLVFVAAGPLVRRSMRRRIDGQLRRLKTMVELEAVL
jgi:carbon monoxide dehydrogenase subunit G